ncbi:PE-PGRS family protein [Streptomyces angustmyceticus]|uniref:PE-PGRS family protein n=1 Tax=Streptomyces angustmyceticus TaxID=285578 RepID=UPI00380E20BA
MEAGRVLRGLRAVVFATVCVLLTALGHALAARAPLPWHVVLAAAAGASAAAWCFARRERGPGVVGLLTLGTQAALHTVFTVGQVSPGPADGPWSWGRLWRKILTCDGGSPIPSALSGGGAAHGPMPGMPASLHEGMQSAGHSMLAVHLAVAAVSAWWLWGGEQAAFRLVRTVSLFLFRRLCPLLCAVLPAAREELRVPAQPPRRALRELLLAHVVSLRGPPREPAVR